MFNTFRGKGAIALVVPLFLGLGAQAQEQDSVVQLSISTTCGCHHVKTGAPSYQGEVTAALLIEKKRSEVTGRTTEELLAEISGEQYANLQKMALMACSSKASGKLDVSQVRVNCSSDIKLGRLR